MAEKIGLIVELDLAKFTRAVNSYIGSISKMQAANTALAGSAGLAFRSMQGSIVTSLGRSSGALGGFIHQLGQVKTQLGSTFNTGQATRQLNTLNAAIHRTIASMGRLSSTRANVNIGGVGGALGGLAGGAAGAVGGITSGIGSIFGVVGGLGKAFTTVVGLISRSVSTIIGLVAGLASGIARVVGGAINIVVGLGRAFFSVVGTIGNAIGAIIRTVSGLVSGIARVISSVINIVIGLGRAFFSVVGTIASAVTSVLRTVGSLVSGVVGAFTSMLHSVLSVVGNLVSGIVNAFASLVGGVLNVIGKLASSIANAFSSIVGGVLSIVGSLARSVVGVFSSLLRSVTTVVGNIASSVFNIFSSLAKSVVGVVAGMASAVLNTVMNMANKVKDTLFAIASSILSSYRDLGTQLLRIVTVATAAVVGATILAGKKMAGWLSDAIGLAATFEQDMANIASVLRATTAEVGPLADKIDELALDPMLVVSTADASAVMEQLARNGLTMTQILEGAAESSILLANATGAGPDSFAKAADIATMAMQMFGLEAAEMNRIADVSQGVINNSRIDLDDWALALGNGGAAAATANVSLEEYATGIAATVNLYHTARQAGTGMTNFIQRLVPLTEVAADEMRQLGLFTGLSEEEFASLATEIAETEQRIADLDPRMVHYDELVEAHTKHAEELKKQMVAGNNAFFDAKGNFIGLANASEILKNATIDLSDEEQLESFRRIFGNDALETAIGMARMGADAFKKLQSEIAIGGSAAEAAAVRTATLAARWRNLGDIWEAIQRKSGAGFNKMLLNLVNRLTELTNKNQDRVIAFFGNMADLINKIVEAALPWVERQLPMLIDNLEALASWLVEVALGGGKAEEWFGKMHPALRNFIERVIGVARGVRQFAKEVIAFGQTLMVAMRPFINFIKENVELKDVLIAAAGAIAYSIVPGFLKMIAVGGLAVKAVSAIRKAWETDWMGIRSFFENLWPKIKGPLVDFINNLLTGKWRDAWANVVTVVGTALSALEAVVPPFFKTFVNLLSDLLRGDWKGVWQNFVKIATSSFDLIKEGLGKLDTPFTRFILNVLEGDWESVWKSISTVATTAFELLKKGLIGLDNPFTDFIVDILEGDWESVWKKIGNVAVFSFEAMKKGLKSLDNPFTNFIVKILEGDWEGVWADITKVAKIAFNKILDFLDEMETPFTDFLANVLTGAWDRAWKYIGRKSKEAFDTIVDELHTLDTPFSNFVTDILEGKWGDAWATASDFLFGEDGLFSTKLPNALRGLDTPFTSFIADILEGKWASAWQAATNFLFGDEGLFSTKLPNALRGLDTPFTSFIADILEGKWSVAWETATNYLFGEEGLFSTKLPNALRGLDTPFTSFIADILEGKWGTAWTTAKDFLFGTDGLFSVKLPNALRELDTPFTTFIADILEGKWGVAWTTAKDFMFGTDGLFSTKLPNALRELDTPFTTFIADILEGKWGTAWTTAKDFLFGTDGLFNVKLPNALRDLDTPFTTFIADILEGKWGTAWTTARDFLFGADGLLNVKLPNALRELDTPFTTFIADILEGKWGAAWTTAKDFLFGTDGLFSIKLPNALRDLDTPFTTFIADILEGKWGTAWQTAYDFLFKDGTGLFPIFLAWMGEKSQPIVDWFNTKMPNSSKAATDGFVKVKDAYNEFVAAATNTETNANLDNLASVVITAITTALAALLQAGTAIVLFLQGDWQGGWTAAGNAVKTFGELPVLNSISTWFGTTFPAASKLFLDEMPKIADAWKPVIKNWPETWNTISNWWNNSVVPFLQKTMVSLTDYFSVTLQQWGIFFEALEVLINTQGSIADKLSAAFEVTKKISVLEADFWNREKERSKINITSDVLTPGTVLPDVINDSENNVISPGGAFLSPMIPQSIVEQQNNPIAEQIGIIGAEIAAAIKGLGSVTNPAPELGLPAVTNAAGSEYFKGGLTWVGERGPELVRLPTGSSILSNSKSMAFLSKNLQQLGPLISSITAEINRSVHAQMTAAAQPRSSTSASYSTVNSPVTINNYVYNQMDQAQLEYMMQNTLNRAGLGLA